MRCCFEGRPVAEAFRQAVKREVYDWSRKQRQRLAEDQSAHDRDTQWLAQFRASASAEGQRQSAEHGSQSGHENGPESQQAGLINGVDGTLAALALGLERKVDHHDGVLLHDSYQQDDSYERNDAEIGVRNQQGEKRSDAG